MQGSKMCLEVLALAKRAAHGIEANTPFIQPYGIRPVSRFFSGKMFSLKMFSCSFLKHGIFQESISCLFPLRHLDFACIQRQ